MQPVDVWVRRTVKLLSGSNMSDEEIAKWIVLNSGNPERANQGIWYFASQVSGSEFRLRRCVQDRAYCETLYKRHIASLRDAVFATRSL